jgi:hypothetical protein
MDATPNLKLPYILAAQAQKHVTHNEAIRALDALVHIGVLDRDLTAPPANPADGERHIVASSAIGAWAGKDGALAAFQDGAWAFYTPRVGWLAWVGDESALVAWNGSAWTAAGAGSLNPAPLVGVNTTADVTTRFAVASAASLFNHAGTDHRLNVNKASTGATASVLFQTGYSGRAEFGTTGDDDWHVKVSGDGATWREALVVDRNTGKVRFPNTTLGREQLSAARTYYVRGDGSDANAGLANSPSGAFATIQKAIDTASALDMSTFNVTIRIANGTYTTTQTLKSFLGSGQIIIEGNVAAPASVLINPPGHGFTGTFVGTYALKGLKLVCGSGGFGAGIYTIDQGIVTYEAVDFGTCSMHVYAFGGQITAIGNYAISGGASRHWLAGGPGAKISCAGRTISLIGAPTFSNAFAHAEDLAQVRATSNTFVGAASGRRYIADALGLIQTNGAGASALPGSLDGAVSGGGLYVSGPFTP